jgi:hypothetical protein
MKGLTKAVILITVSLAVLLPLASTFPDGLEKVAETLGIAEPEPIWKGLMPDYTLPLLGDAYASRLISGLLGLFLAICAAWAIGRAITRENHAS